VAYLDGASVIVDLLSAFSRASRASSVSCELLTIVKLKSRITWRNGGRPRPAIHTLEILVGKVLTMQQIVPTNHLNTSGRVISIIHC